MNEDGRECPMCGEVMRLVTREMVEHVPGQPKPVRHVVQEWVCPECDYFEDAEAEDIKGG